VLAGVAALLLVGTGCAAMVVQAQAQAATQAAARAQENRRIESLASEVGALRAEATARAAITPTPVPTATPQPTPTLTPEQALRPVLDSTVFVETSKGAATGVILGAGGVVTSHHVVDGVSSVTVRFADQRSAPAQVVRVDRRRDLALLAVETREIPLTLGETEGLQPGASLLAAGFPRSAVIGARSATVTRGAFSSLWRSPDDIWFVQTDAALNPGNSGGPVVDAQGRVMGIATFNVPGSEGLNYAVAANEVRTFLSSTDNPPPPPAPTATPRPSPRQQFFQAFDAVLAVHQANRDRLGTAYGNFRSGKMTPAAFAAEVDYQITARSLTRQEAISLIARTGGDPALTNLVADFVTSMDLSVQFVQTERAMLTRGVARTDEASWKALEAQGNVSTARFETFKQRYDALRRS
jgi:S1-C subfamily serine protease